jgi:CRISPR/Cas system endoribonuclease Cas6 (RAMP superfamily)
MHEQGGYTVSGIHRQVKGQPGQYYVRITSLVSDLTDTLLEAVLPNARTFPLSPRADSPHRNPKAAPLPDLDVVGYAVERAAHPLAGLTSFVGLIQSTSRADCLDMEFASPTAFGANGADQPLPAPAIILRSWTEKWNNFAPASERLGYPVQQFTNDCVLLSGLWNIHTANWNLPNRARGLGFQGRVQMKMRPLKDSENWQTLWDRFQRDWQVLAAFSLYCGTGRHTSAGMGQTHSLGVSGDAT